MTDLRLVSDTDAAGEPEGLAARLREGADWLAEELPADVVAPQFLEGDVRLDELDAYCVEVMREAAGVLAPGGSELLRMQLIASRLLEALRTLLGHCEIAAVMPAATGNAYVMDMDAEPLRIARTALAAAEEQSPTPPGGAA